MTFNSLYLGFFHESNSCNKIILNSIYIFQFPLLGIFPWILTQVVGVHSNLPDLSIPSTWDFSMNHHTFGSRAVSHIFSFNSLYLGFFHESRCRVCRGTRLLSFLSIPSTWDFSMNQTRRSHRLPRRFTVFQFPLLGIFPWISKLPFFGK